MTAARTPQVIMGQGSPLTATAPAGRRPPALRGSSQQHCYAHRAASQLIAVLIGVTTNGHSSPQGMPSLHPINPIDRPPLPARGSSGLASRSKHTGSTVLSPSAPSSHRQETASATRAPQRSRAPASSHRPILGYPLATPTFRVRYARPDGRPGSTPPGGRPCHSRGLVLQLLVQQTLTPSH